MNTATIRPITFAELFDSPNADALFSEYAAESSIQGLPTPTPCRALYESIEAGGAAHVIGAFDGGLLIGFIVVVVSLNPHYSAVLAVSESYFVAADHRKSGAGLKLLHAAEELAHRCGALGMFVSAPVESRLAKLLPDMPYTETNRAFFRRFA